LSERRFWAEQFKMVGGLDSLVDIISDYDDLDDEGTCYEDILPEAKKYKDKILAYEHYIPAVRQAVELMLSRN